MSIQITKAVIPAAGIGKRLMPITCTVPKEMFPVGCYPSIEWVICEAVASGCKDIAVVINHRKQMIQEYFMTCCPDLSGACRIRFLIQSEPLGIGHALTLAKDFAAGQPVAVLLPDDLCVYEKPPILQMKDIYTHYGTAVFAMVKDNISNWWKRNHWHLRKVNRNTYLLETNKPNISSESENIFLAGIGRYILSPLFFTFGEKLLNTAREGELDDAAIFDELMKNGESVAGYKINAKRYDISRFDGYVAAWEYFGKRNPLDVYLTPRKK